MATRVIGVDLGGTNLRAAAIDGEGRLLDRAFRPSNIAAGPEAVVSAIAAIIRQLSAQAPAGVGVAVPGIIEMVRGVVRNSPNLPGFEEYPVREAVEQALGTRVVLENDANAAALGERWMGAGRGCDDLILLTLGTGVGGGIISGGKVMHGQAGMAAELGHIKVVPDGNPCGCGSQGCLEAHASATAVSSMAKLMSLGDVTCEEACRLAAGGNERAQAVFRAMGKALGTALADLINIFNFPLYLLSGGVLPAWELFAPAMMEEVVRSSYVYRGSPARIEKAALGGDAGLYGAAYLALGDGSV